MTTNGKNGYSPLESTLPPLLDVSQVAALTQLGERTVWRYVDAGRMPRPLPLGRLKRWRRDELMKWIEEGCPAEGQGR